MSMIEIGNSTLKTERGDITKVAVDAIVNAANSSLMGGSGVDGAIHRAGGDAILEACRVIVAAQGSLPTGEAVITTAGELPAKNVIHTVGPVWQDGTKGENVDLERCFTNCLQLAVDEGLRSVAFPAISCGAYGFPAEPAALIAFNTIVRFLRENPESLDEVRVVLFDEDTAEAFEGAFEEGELTMLG